MSTRRSYTAAEKLKVVRYAEAHGNRAAGREFDDISEANVHLWRRQKTTLAALPRSNLQLATLENSNPMHNMHPKV